LKNKAKKYMSSRNKKGTEKDKKITQRLLAIEQSKIFGLCSPCNDELTAADH